MSTAHRPAAPLRDSFAIVRYGHRKSRKKPDLRHDLIPPTVLRLAFLNGASTHDELYILDARDPNDSDKSLNGGAVARIDPPPLTSTGAPEAGPGSLAAFVPKPIFPTSPPAFKRERQHARRGAIGSGPHMSLCEPLASVTTAPSVRLGESLRDPPSWRNPPIELGVIHILNIPVGFFF